MININNKVLNELSFEDVQNFLSSAETENFFIEFKLDDARPENLAKEISAFANTYGGYIFIGISDNKEIIGCQKWDEQRIHTTIHEWIAPVPIFHVKCLEQEVKIFVIRIEEGLQPPYITKKGQIFERISSGSFPIKESSRLTQLYNKSENALKQTKNKIELPYIDTNGAFPANCCAYLDMGFSTSLSGETELQKNFYNIDLTPVSKYLCGINPQYNISRVGYSYVFSIGEMIVKDNTGKEQLLKAGMNNFVEIMLDGSVKSRILLSADNDSKVNVIPIILMYSFYRTIFAMIMGSNFSDIFISAQKYERLTVLYQFVPYLKLGSEDTEENKIIAKEYADKHNNRFGGNLIISSSRVPTNNYYIIDKQSFNLQNNIYNTENLIEELFNTDYFNLGFIEPLDFMKEENNK